MYFLTKIKIFLIQNAIIILTFFILISYYIYDSKTHTIENIIKTNEYTIKKLKTKKSIFEKKKQELTKEMNDLQELINWYKISPLDQKNLISKFRQLINDTGLLHLKNIKIKPSDEYINVVLIKLSIISKSRYFKVSDFSDIVVDFLKKDYKIIQVDRSNPNVLDIYLAWYKIRESDKKKQQTEGNTNTAKQKNNYIENSRKNQSKKETQGSRK